MCKCWYKQAYLLLFATEMRDGCESQDLFGMSPTCCGEMKLVSDLTFTCPRLLFSHNRARLKHLGQFRSIHVLYELFSNKNTPRNVFIYFW